MTEEVEITESQTQPQPEVEKSEEEKKDQDCSLQFCPECNNLLYPKEDKIHKKLLLICKSCDFKKVSTSNLIFRDNLKFNLDYKWNTTNWKEFSQDPTIPRQPIKCPKCSHNEAAVQSDFGMSAFAQMKLYFICTNKKCGHRWNN